MSRRLQGMALLCLVGVSGLAAAETAEELLRTGHVMIRARVEPAVVFVGQRADLKVDVLTKTWFLKAPQLPDTLAIPEAVVLPPETFGVNFSERIDGDSYAGQTRTLTIFPTRPGRLELPPVPVKLAVADDSASRTPDFTLWTPALEIEVQLPEGARGYGLVVATPSLTARQDVSPRPQELRVGDALRRTVTTTIENSVAMLLPAIPFDAPEGVSVYPERPTFDDRRDRGQMAGTRSDIATYVFEREGAARLPELVIHWWDLGADRLRTETLPAIELEIAAAPLQLPLDLGPAEEVMEGPEEPVAQPLPWRRLLLAVVAVAVLAAGGRWLGRCLRRVFSRRPAREDAERIAFRALCSAARAQDPGATLAALYRWRDTLDIEGPPTLGALTRSIGDPRLNEEFAALAAASAGQGPAPDGRRLIRLIEPARRRARTERGAGRRGFGTLSPLNPESRPISAP